MCCGRGCVGVGAQHCPLGLHALWGLRAAGVVGGRPRGWWPATVVRGVWCQALSLERAARVPRPVCPGCGWCGRGDPAPAPQRAPLRPGLLAVGVAKGRPRGGCLPPLSGASSFEAGSQGFATRMSRVRVRLLQAWGPSTGPTACTLAGRRCSLWGWRKGVPGGGCLPPFRGASEVRRCPSLACPPTGRAVGVRNQRAVGAGVWVWGPNTVPLACMPCGGCVPRGWWGAVPGGDGLPHL